MNPTEPARTERLLPVTWPIWIAWVLVAALVPVLSTISATAFGKRISPDAEYPALVTNGLRVLIAFATLAPPIMQGLVLKRLMPKLSVGLWFFCILASGSLWFVLTLCGFWYGPALVGAGFQTPLHLQGAVLIHRLAGTHIFDLSWGPIFCSGRSRSAQ
jgi:hypothetical protein